MSSVRLCQAETNTSVVLISHFTTACFVFACRVRRQPGQTGGAIQPFLACNIDSLRRCYFPYTTLTEIIEHTAIRSLITIFLSTCSKTATVEKSRVMNDIQYYGRGRVYGTQYQVD